MQKENYQLMLEKELKIISDAEEKPKLLLHVCCAPCSSYVLEYLSSYFDITLFFYNPNITSEKEYNYRIDEAKRLISEMPLAGKTEFFKSVHAKALDRRNAEIYGAHSSTSQI